MVTHGLALATIMLNPLLGQEVKMKNVLLLCFCCVGFVGCGVATEAKPIPFTFDPTQDSTTDMGDGDSSPDAMDADMAPDEGPVDMAEDLVVDTRDIAQRLFEISGVVGIQEEAGMGNFRIFTLSVRQPLDHTNPDSATFIQRMYLFHRSVTAPVVLVTSGYGLGELASYRQFPVEISQLLDGNHIFLGHRFFDGALPSSQNQDWSKVNIKQGADDNHRIVTMLKDIYDTPWIGTGWSKGGMTAIFHERFHPDDLDLVVPMVAPISFEPMDQRYPPALAQIGTQLCRETLEESIIATLGRLDEMMDAFQVPANERAEYRAWFKQQIISYAWGFWQYLGANACNSIPNGALAPIEDLGNFYFYYMLPGPAFAIDEEDAQNYTYTYQSETQLGYQDSFEQGYLERLELLGHVTPQEVMWYRVPVRDQFGDQTPWDVWPAFDPAPMQDVDQWLRSDASDMLAIYGEYDPWTAGKVTLNAAKGSKVYIAPRGSHSTFLQDLSPSDFQEVRSRIGEFAQPSLNGLVRVVTPKVDRKQLRRMLLGKQL